MGAEPPAARKHVDRARELVARGHSNKQVAGALFLSETVQNALTRVYAKLGVRSRTQLTRTLLPLLVVRA